MPHSRSTYSVDQIEEEVLLKIRKKNSESFKRGCDQTSQEVLGFVRMAISRVESGQIDAKTALQDLLTVVQGINRTYKF